MDAKEVGAANRGQFSAKTGHGETRQLPKELMDASKRGLRTVPLDEGFMRATRSPGICLGD